jgi:hypothetical protein
MGHILSYYRQLASSPLIRQFWIEIALAVIGSCLALGAILIRAQLPVESRPPFRNYFAFGLGCGLLCSIPIFAAIDYYNWRQNYLDKIGVQGTAKLVSFETTSFYVARQPMAKFVLDVSIPGSAEYRVSLRKIIPLGAIGEMQKGKQLDVKVNPKDKSDVLIEW